MQRWPPCTARRAPEQRLPAQIQLAHHAHNGVGGQVQSASVNHLWRIVLRVIRKLGFGAAAGLQAAGGNAALQAAFGCKIVIPAGIERMVAEWDTGAMMLDAAKQRGERFAHDAVIEPGSEFEMGGMSWQALPAPGHDMEALVYYCAAKRILISGDALWQDGFGIIFGEVMGRKDALPATRSTLEMIGRLGVDIVIPGHGAAFDDFDAAMARALRRLESFEADSSRVARNAVRACFTFNLLDLQRLHEDELSAYLKSVPFFDGVNQRILKFSDEDFASWLLGELLRSRTVEVRDGWILPTMAP